MRARRGAKGGYWLAKPADEVTVADVVRAVEGRPPTCGSFSPEAVAAPAATPSTLQEVRIAVRANLRAVLEHVTLADLVSGELPEIN